MNDHPTSRSAYESAKNGAGTLFVGALGAMVLIVSIVGVMWAVEVLDYILPTDFDREFGIVGWEIDGLIGIPLAPFLHGGFGHLMANSVPLLILGFFAAVRGIGRFLGASLIIIVIGGLGTWATSPDVYTVGASGLVFGYFGYVLARGLFDRRVIDILIGLGVAVAYYSLIAGVLPNQPGISWQGHLFGLVGGVLAAWLLRRKRPVIAAPAY